MMSFVRWSITSSTSQTATISTSERRRARERWLSPRKPVPMMARRTRSIGLADFARLLGLEDGWRGWRRRGRCCGRIRGGSWSCSHVLSIKYRNLTANKITHALHSIERKFAGDHRVAGFPVGYGVADPAAYADLVARGVDVDGGRAELIAAVTCIE